MCLIKKCNFIYSQNTPLNKGFERPGYFIEGGTVPVQKYDWYGFYGREKNKNTSYVEKLAGDYKFEFSDYHNLVSNFSDFFFAFFRSAQFFIIVTLI
jgi:hypothetical protein